MKVFGEIAALQITEEAQYERNLVLIYTRLVREGSFGKPFGMRTSKDSTS